MSAGGYLDACGFIATSTGTGSFVVSAAATGCQTPASASAANTAVYSYRAESADKSQWEEGFGAYTVSTTTLARSTITANSSGGTTAISFTTIPNVYVTALSQDLANASLLTSGTLPVARLNGGTANQFVQGDGSCQTQGRTLLNTLTASNSVNLNDTSSLTSAFSEYEITFENLVPVTNNVTIGFQVHSGGAFQGTSYTGVNMSTGSSTGITNSTAQVIISQPSTVQNTSAGLSGSLRIFTPSNTTGPKGILGTSGHSNGTFFVLNQFSGAWGGGNGAVDGFEIFCSSGNISTGTVKIYGLN
jgi:hypothetical protein